ncbi:hypothetical protein J6590_097194 [Homalodisca vitripennis]|nr:hypothetical protein J6590_097194 [Homalodisca vitripennis]
MSTPSLRATTRSLSLVNFYTGRTSLALLRKKSTWSKQQATAGLLNELQNLIAQWHTNVRLINQHNLIFDKRHNNVGQFINPIHLIFDIQQATVGLLNELQHLIDQWHTNVRLINEHNLIFDKRHNNVGQFINPIYLIFDIQHATVGLLNELQHLIDQLHNNVRLFNQNNFIFDKRHNNVRQFINPIHLIFDIQQATVGLLNELTSRVIVYDDLFNLALNS